MRPLLEIYLAICKTEGVVLKTTAYSETSLVVSFFTLDYGRIEALAKGARRPKSNLQGALDLFSLSHIVFYQKSPPKLHILSECLLRDNFRGLRTSLQRLSSAFYMSGLILDLTERDGPLSDLFLLFLKTLRSLSAQKTAPGQTRKAKEEGNDIATTLFGFEVGALCILGYLPLFDECASCGAILKPAAELAFSASSGGALCENCRSQVGEKLVISGATRALFKKLAEKNPRGIARLKISPRTASEMRSLLNSSFAQILGKKPKCLEYISS